mmetsp:Transcript_27500/g.72640  ORF Transcript_27500/g.72640 Transcript_27500/m.72640 type:complete len:133 (-) Transcript_27500:800-1198(-)
MYYIFYILFYKYKYKYKYAYIGSRSATNAANGSQSPLCNAVSGLVVALALACLTPLFRAMPYNVLGAVVAVAAVNLVDPREAVFLWRSSKREWCLLVFTFALTAFVALELGILTAVAICVAQVRISVSPRSS